MFKVILFTTLLCCFVFAQFLKEEEILAVKDLATELVTAIAPAKVDKCKVGKVGVFCVTATNLNIGSDHKSYPVKI